MIQVIQVIQVVQVDQMVQMVQVVQVVQVVSVDDIYSENIWFSGSKPSEYRGKLRCHAHDIQTNGRRKVENRAVF